MRRSIRFCVGALVWVSLIIANSSAQAQVYDELTVALDPIDNGILDPSMEYGATAAEGWLFYSFVYGETTPWGPRVETRLASSDDLGHSWTFEQVVNPSTPDTIMLAEGGTVDGYWNYEVSSVAYDPDDPGAQWKLFAHKIFRPVVPGSTTLIEHLVPYSWIVYRTAPDPTGPWSPETPLFSSAFFPPAPYSTIYNVNGFDPSLSAIVAYSEPGAFYHEGVLYLSLTALVPTGSDRVILLRSYDHGATWGYAGTPVTNGDMAAIGYLSLDGTAVVEQDGRQFLVGTPESSAVLHDGTLILEFDDIENGSLSRTAGLLDVIHWVPPQPALLVVGRGGGQADYHEVNGPGLVQPQLSPATVPHLFHIFETGESPLPVPEANFVSALWAGVLALGEWGLRRSRRESRKEMDGSRAIVSQDA